MAKGLFVVAGRGALSRPVQTRLVRDPITCLGESTAFGAKRGAVLEPHRTPSTHCLLRIPDFGERRASDRVPRDDQAVGSPILIASGATACRVNREIWNWSGRGH